jgi:hypothetical protein
MRSPRKSHNVTLAEACELLVDQTRRLRDARRESHVWELLAKAALHYASELWRELEMIDSRRTTFRRYTNGRQLDETLPHEDGV